MPVPLQQAMHAMRDIAEPLRKSHFAIAFLLVVAEPKCCSEKWSEKRAANFFHNATHILNWLLLLIGL
ncbi:MAG: hypothetical protein R3C09_28185 [Pirellulaceae bacterium]